MNTPEHHELIVVGAGPAGLTAAMTAESEGIDSIVVSGNIGGQARESSCVKNYPGMPGGISGSRLTGLLAEQALQFGAEFFAPEMATQIEKTDEGLFVVTTDVGRQFEASTALISTGVQFRQLSARNLAPYLGRGVHYGAPVEGLDHNGKKAVVVGGANSAGQAAVHLAGYNACDVHMVVRGSGLSDSASNYLIEEIDAKSNITVHTHTTVEEAKGGSTLERVVLRTTTEDSPEGQVIELEVDELYVFIGSVPRIQWLPEGVARDNQGFIRTGSSLTPEEREIFAEQTGGRNPYDNETSIPGLFAAGDVRSGTQKRIVKAAADGAGIASDVFRLRSR
jgi:thioredoxin reductase (NADPH)